MKHLTTKCLRELKVGQVYVTSYLLNFLRNHASIKPRPNRYNQEMFSDGKIYPVITVFLYIVSLETNVSTNICLVSFVLLLIYYEIQFVSGISFTLVE